MGVIPHQTIAKLRASITLDERERRQVLTMDAVPYGPLDRCRSYDALIKSESPLFYLTGEPSADPVTVYDEIGNLPGQLVGGVTAGGAKIGGKTSRSFVIPDLPNGSPVAEVLIAAAPALAFAGFPVVEVWAAVDAYTNVSPFPTVWADAAGSVYMQLFTPGVAPDAVTEWTRIESEFGFEGDPPSGAWADSAVGPIPRRSPSGPYHIVAFVQPNGDVRHVLNGVLLDIVPDFSSHLPDPFAPLRAVSGDFVLGGNTALIGAWPGRVSDFAVYDNPGGDTRDVPAMALAHYGAGV